MNGVRIRKTGAPDVIAASDGRLTLSVPIQIKHRSGKRRNDSTTRNEADRDALHFLNCVSKMHHIAHRGRNGLEGKDNTSVSYARETVPGGRAIARQGQECGQEVARACLTNKQLQALAR